MSQPCEKCSGTGLEARQDLESNKVMHPILAIKKGLCSYCAGSGVKQEVDVHAANRKAAASQAG